MTPLFSMPLVFRDRATRRSIRIWWTWESNYFLTGVYQATGHAVAPPAISSQYGYADNISKNVSVDGNKKLFRNTPTLLYAALQPVLFADGRLNFLEDQAKTVIEDHSEMKETFQLLLLPCLKTAPIKPLRISWVKLLWKEPTSPRPWLRSFVPELLLTRHSTAMYREIKQH